MDFYGYGHDNTCNYSHGDQLKSLNGVSDNSGELTKTMDENPPCLTGDPGPFRGSQRPSEKVRDLSPAPVQPSQPLPQGPKRLCLRTNIWKAFASFV